MREEISVSPLSDRDNYEEWYRKGKRNRTTMARDKVRHMLSEHKPRPFSENVEREVQEILSAN